ncbi:MAG: HEPN domain-containing protein [Bacteroidales bacterium]|nr:HEPN domain-containing protein [Bacteroidales bacterium]
MSLSQEERNAIVAYRTEKARMALDEIKKVMPLEVWSIIANRMYYALYYAVSALLTKDSHPVNTHKGALSLVNQYYVKTDILTKEDGHLFGLVFAFRQGSDYDDFIDATKEDVEQLFPKVETLVEKIIALTNEKNS